MLRRTILKRGLLLSLGTVHEIDKICGAVVIPDVSPGSYAKYLGGVSDTRDILKTDLLQKRADSS